jgi:hypothetical protein
MRQFERIANDLGPTRLEAGAVATTIEGGVLRRTETFPWVKRYFGGGAGWDRYQYVSVQGVGAERRQQNAVTLDLIWTEDLSSFSTYGIEACYKFRNYRILDARRFDLGAGVIARSLVYYNPGTGATWTGVYWEWPVRAGSGERYERVVLNTTSVGPQEFDAPHFASPIESVRLALTDGLLGDARGPLPSDVARGRDFLASLAERIVSATTASSEHRAREQP